MPIGSPARLLVAVVALLCTLVVGADVAEAYSAHGSVEQVYVTGLPAGAKLSLFNRRGRRVARRRADALGGLLFRNVKPGGGYRVRRSRKGRKSAKLTVLSKRSAPPRTGVYGQGIPSRGYGYLTTRDGTKLAYYVHPPQDIANVLPVGSAVPHV